MHMSMGLISMDKRLKLCEKAQHACAGDGEDHAAPDTRRSGIKP